jgi:hypothetical protein
MVVGQDRLVHNNLRPVQDYRPLQIFVAVLLMVFGRVMFRKIISLVGCSM